MFSQKIGLGAWSKLLGFRIGSKLGFDVRSGKNL